MKTTLAVLLSGSALATAIALPATGALPVPGDMHPGAPAAIAGDDHQPWQIMLASDGEDDDDDDDVDDDEGGRRPAPAGATTPPNNGLFGNGGTPMVNVK